MKFKNEYILHNDYAEIIINKKNSSALIKAKIDLDDVVKCKPYRWCLHSKGYIYNSVGKILLHRYLIICQPDKQVDHINSCRIDNRKSNLRIVSNQENQFNRKEGINNKSGHRGVIFHKSLNRWQSFIRFNRRMIHLGTFENKKDAIKYRLDAEIKYFGKYSYVESKKIAGSVI